MATKSGVFETKNKLPAFMKGVQKLARRDVLVGIPDDRSRGNEKRGPQAGRNQRDDSSGVTNAQLGYIHNEGAPEVGIPKREFLGPGIKEGLPQTTPHLKNAARAMIDGKKQKADKELAAAGMEAMSAVQMKLKSGPFVPLSPRTIAARRVRSKGSKYRRKATTAADTKPLIDTAQMLRAVTYVVRDGVK